MTYVCTLTDANKYLLEGKDVVSDLSALYEVITNKSVRRIEMTDAFVDKFFTQTSLRNFINEVKKINPLLKVITSLSRYSMDDERIEKVMGMKSPEELVQFAIQDTEALKLIQSALSENIEAKKDSMLANAKMSAMHLELATLQAEKDLSVDRESVTMKLYETTYHKLDTLVSRINNNYSKDVDTKKMLGVRTRPGGYRKIIYFKEISRVKYLDTFVYYIQEIIKTMYGTPARLLVMEARDAASRAYMYPTCVPYTQLTYNDIYLSDIFLAGFQPKLVDSIVSDPSKIEYLIVVDRTGWETPYIIGGNVEHIYTVSDMKDIRFNCPLSQVMSYSEETLHVKHIKGFDKMNMDERIKSYSSMSSMKHIINLMERG